MGFDIWVYFISPHILHIHTFIKPVKWKKKTAWILHLLVSFGLFLLLLLIWCRSGYDIICAWLGIFPTNSWDLSSCAYAATSLYIPLCLPAITIFVSVYQFEPFLFGLEENFPGIARSERRNQVSWSRPSSSGYHSCSILLSRQRNWQNSWHEVLVEIYPWSSLALSTIIYWQSTFEV